MEESREAILVLQQDIYENEEIYAGTKLALQLCILQWIVVIAEVVLMRDHVNVETIGKLCKSGCFNDLYTLEHAQCNTFDIAPSDATTEYFCSISSVRVPSLLVC